MLNVNAVSRKILIGYSQTYPQVLWIIFFDIFMCILKVVFMSIINQILKISYYFT